MNLSFAKVATVGATGLIAGRIYFEESTGLIKVATSATEVKSFGGVQDAEWTADQHLVITNANGSVIDLNLSDVASATEVAAAIAGKADKTYVDDELAKKVDKVAGSRLMTDAEGTKLTGIAAGAQVNVIESVKVNGTALTPDSNKSVNVVIPAAKVDGVVADDKILSLTGTKVGSTLNLTYDSTAKKINLTGVGGQSIASVDATAFIKDGMVNTVSFDPETKVLTITFNTESGKEPVEVDLTSLVDTYTAGTGISITGNSIAVNTSVIATKTSVDDINVKLGAGFTSTSTVAQQLAAVKTTAEAATTVSEVNAQIDAKLEELVDSSTGTGNLIVGVSQTDGKVSVTKGSAAIADVTGLQGALDGKALKATTINGKALSTNVVLAGSDIKVTGYAKGTSAAIAATDTINQALGKLEAKADAAMAAGVTSFGGKTGAITLATAVDGNINLAMTNNVLGATLTWAEF